MNNSKKSKLGIQKVELENTKIVKNTKSQSITYKRKMDNTQRKSEQYKKEERKIQKGKVENPKSQGGKCKT